jgi:hypothetical protein
VSKVCLKPSFLLANPLFPEVSVVRSEPFASWRQGIDLRGEYVFAHAVRGTTLPIREAAVTRPEPGPGHFFLPSSRLYNGPEIYTRPR